MTIDVKCPVLVVDDSGAVRTIVRKLLTTIGINDVDEASNGVDALEKLSGKSYGLVISDWNMEPMNGKLLLERVRGNPASKSLPFIMMTTDSAQYKIMEAKYVAVRFLSKPFDKDTLAAKVCEIMRR